MKFYFRSINNKAIGDISVYFSINRLIPYLTMSFLFTFFALMKIVLNAPLSRVANTRGVDPDPDPIFEKKTDPYPIGNKIRIQIRPNEIHPQNEIPRILL